MGCGKDRRTWKVSPYVSMCTARVPKGLMSQDVSPEGSAIAKRRRRPETKEIDAAKGFSESMVFEEVPLGMPAIRKSGTSAAAETWGKSTLKLHRSLCDSPSKWGIDASWCILPKMQLPVPHSKRYRTSRL